MNITEQDGLREQELERRIEELDDCDEAAFGRFTAWDWTACIVLSIVLPLIAIWWFAP